MSARACVTSENDVGAFVNRKAVVLVHDHTVLDREIVLADVKTVCVVPRCFAATLRIGLVTRSYAYISVEPNVVKKQNVQSSTVICDMVRAAVFATLNARAGEFKTLTFYMNL